MGYRSNIGLAISKKAKLQSILFDKKLPILKEADESLSNDDAVYYIFESWKWYEDSPNIKELMDFLDELPSEDYGYIRIGEETDDIEELGNPWDYDLYVNRSICTPFD